MPTDEVGPRPTPPLPPLDWRRNLAALWLAEFTAILGFSFAFPFLPLFLHRDLHIPSGRQLFLLDRCGGGCHRIYARAHRTGLGKAG